MGASDGYMETIQVTEANTCINTKQEFFSKKDIGGLDEMVLKRELEKANENIKKPFYNEFELIEKIKALVKKEGNDFELGGEIRKMFV